MLKAVVLPGLDGTGALLEGFAAALAAHFDVRVIPYPVDASLSYPQLRDFVRAQLPQDDFVLIAESFSGPVAIGLAAERPSGLRALVLCASFARVDLPAKSLLSRAASMVSPHRLPTALLSRLLWGRWHTRERAQSLARALSQVRADVLQARAREALSVDLSAEAPLALPTLYLQAMRDRLIGRSAIETLRTITPDLHVQRLDAPHFVLQVRPVEAAGAIADFVREHHSGS